MTTPLDVLLIETEPYAGLHSARELSRSGHRVRRCYPYGPGAPSPSADEPRMCTALTGGTCPIDDGGIDVAVVAGPAATDHVALTAAGVTCALRHHIPLVADDTCDTSFGSRFVRRADGHVVDACERASDAAFADLRADILRRFAPALAAEQLAPSEIDATFTTDGPRLVVTLTGPPVDRSLRSVLSVRVLDAIRASGRVFGQVNVAYEPLEHG